MIDTGPIVRLAEQLCDQINEQIDDTQSFVRQAMILVEIDLGPSTALFSVSADDRAWVQVAFLEAHADELERRRILSLEDE